MIKVCTVCGEAAEHKSWKSYTCNDCLDVGIKWCPKCEEVHSIDNFHKNGSTLRSFCKACECTRSVDSKEKVGYYARPGVKERRNADSALCKRARYNTDEEYRGKEIQRCRVREATKENRGYYTKTEWDATLSIFKQSCAYCGAEHRLTREHIIPLVDGGTNTIENVIPACLRCNASKGRSSMVEWFKKQPFYSDERLELIISYSASKKGSDAKCLI